MLGGTRSRLQAHTSRRNGGREMKESSVSRSWVERGRFGVGRIERWGSSRARHMPKIQEFVSRKAQVVAVEGAVEAQLPAAPPLRHRGGRTGAGLIGERFDSLPSAAGR